MSHQPTLADDQCRNCMARTHLYTKGIGLPYTLTLKVTNCCKKRICSKCMKSRPTCPICHKEFIRFPPRDIVYEDPAISRINRATDAAQQLLSSTPADFPDARQRNRYGFARARAIEMSLAGEDIAACAEVLQALAQGAAEASVETRTELRTDVDNQKLFRTRVLARAPSVDLGCWDEDFSTLAAAPERRPATPPAQKRKVMNRMSFVSNASRSRAQEQRRRILARSQISQDVRKLPTGMAIKITGLRPRNLPRPQKNLLGAAHVKDEASETRT